MSTKPQEIFDVAIVGGGLAGHTAALMLARKLADRKDFSIALIAPRAEIEDGRTTALLGSSIDHLKKLGVWQACQEFVAPLSTMRILDGSNRIWRAPPVEFKSVELGLDAFGYNIANGEFVRVFRKIIENMPNISVIEGYVENTGIQDGFLQLNLKDGGTVSAKLAIAADGRNSRLRQDAQISVRKWQYPQTAIAVNLAHVQPHYDTSTEFHTEEGPFTVVPMPSQGEEFRSGLVWIRQPAQIDQFLQLSKSRQEELIEQTMQSMLGKIELVSAPQKFPMSGMIARQFAASRVALVADAAHVFPPIGAQGFNLGLRDIVEICELAARALIAGRDPGSESTLGQYDRRRRVDVTTRTGAVDLLNRSLLTDFLPVQALRGLGLFALAHVPALRQLAMRKGMALRMENARKSA